MKKKILFLLLMIQYVSHSQSEWQPLEYDDFNRASYSSAEFAGRNPIVIKNGKLFFFNNERGYSKKQFTINKYSGNQWEHIGFPVLMTNNITPVIDWTVGNNEVPYVIFNNITNALPEVWKYENSTWDQVGTSISAVTSSILNINLGTDNLPRILFREGNRIKLKRFDGSNWILISDTTEFIPYTSLSLELDNNNVPYVLSNNSQSSCFVKKFNGIGWEEVGITGFANEGKTLKFDNSNIPHLGISNTVKKFDGSAWVNLSVPLTAVWPNTSIGMVQRIDFNSNNDLFVGYLGGYYSSSNGYYIKKMTNGSWQELVANGSYADIVFAASGENAYYVKFFPNFVPKIYKYSFAQPSELLGSYSYITWSTGSSDGEILSHDFSICNGIPMVAYKNGQKASVKQFINNSWVNVGTDILSENDVQQTMIQSGTNGNIYLAYSNKLSSTQSDTKLTVKVITPTTWAPVGGINFSLTAGTQFDFKLSNNNEPYVLYMSGRVQKFDGTNWVFIGGSAYNGDAASRLALDVNDVPYIAFIDASNSNHIAVKKFNGTIWEYVDQPGLAAYAGRQYRPRIVIDALNTVYLGFTDNLRRLHIKKLNNGLWESVASDLFTTAWTDQFEISVDNNNVTYVLYNEVENDFTFKAKVKKFNGTNWESVGLPTISAGGMVAGKIDFSNNNTPIIAYSSRYESGTAALIDARFFNSSTLINNESQQLNQNWIIAPNPVGNMFSINRNDEIQSLEIYDLTGKKMILQNDNFNNVNVSSLSTGIYIVKLKTTNGISTIKLVKK